MKTDSLDTKYGLFWYVVLEQYLRGRETAFAIAKGLGLSEVPLTLKHVLNEQDFRLAVYEARKRPAEATIKFVQQNLFKYASAMDILAGDSTDKRTQLTALKDLMDRGGMGASQKIDIKSPTAYKAAVADLMEDEIPTVVSPTEAPVEPHTPEETE